MKATGIVRRIDDLGRVVIPKEVRLTMGIKEGDTLEIYTEDGGAIVFKKYDAAGQWQEQIMRLRDSIKNDMDIKSETRYIIAQRMDELLKIVKEEESHVKD